VSTVKDFFKSWLEAKRPETADSTFDFYSQTANSFLAHLGDRTNLDIGAITRNDVLTFRNTLALKLAAKTVNHRIKTVRMIFKAASRDSFITQNPADHVETVKKKGETKRRPFTTKELQAVLSVTDSEWSSLIKIGLYTGQRLGDLALLEWRNIDLQRGEVRFVTRKTERPMIIKMAESLRKHLSSLTRPDDANLPVHPKAYAAVIRAKGRVVTLSRQFGELLAKTGLRKKKTHDSTGIGRNSVRQANELSFHCLRHTAVSLLKDAGVPQAVVMEFIGHESIDMSHQYTHVGEEALEKAAAAFPEL
jgi:integrase